MARRRHDSYSFARDIILIAVNGVRNGELTPKEADVLIKAANAIVYSLSQESTMEMKVEEIKELAELKQKLHELGVSA